MTDDGDTTGQGEIAFDFFAGGAPVGDIGFRRYGSGDTVVPRMSGTTRPGIWRTVPVDGLSQLGLMVGGVECDWQRLSKCPREAGGSDYTSVAKATVDLRAAFVQGGRFRPASAATFLRPRRLRGLLDGRRRLRFRAYATLDVHVA